MLHPEDLDEKQKTMFVLQEKSGIKEEIKAYLHSLSNRQKECVHILSN